MPGLVVKKERGHIAPVSELLIHLGGSTQYSKRAAGLPVQTGRSFTV